MIKKENIKQFVRETLGCDCPEKVFEYIDCQQNIQLNEAILLINRINIGNRLLIYIIEVNDSNFIESNLSTVISMGKNERDKRGFNRFRLVVITDKMDEMEQVSPIIFKNLKDKDEKIHLHVINRNAISL